MPMTVQKDAPVNWKGGEPWRATLADAVRPLGLVVTVSGPKVTITTGSRSLNFFAASPSLFAPLSGSLVSTALMETL